MDINTTNSDKKKDIENIVCLYYAKLNSSDPIYKSDCTKNLKLVANFFGLKHATLKNRKDVYDAMFDNNRKGWHKLGHNIDRRPELQKIYEEHKDTPLTEHANIVNDIITSIKSSANLYFSIKTKDHKIVEKIINKEQNIEFTGINILKDKLAVGQLIFIVLGGDKPAWNTGLKAIGILSKEPYDEGYDGNKNFKVQVDIKLLLSDAIKREKLIPYSDTYGLIGIGPITKWEPNQALSQVEEAKAIALMRAMLEIDPVIEPDLNAIISNSIMQRIKGSTRIFIPINVMYKEPILDAVLDELNEAEELTSPQEEVPSEPYTKDDFLNEVFMSENNYDTLCNLLENKKNIILQGAPGVGKTFAAKRLAYSILGAIDNSNIEMIQFHQSYSYEDFVLGYKPNETGFSLEYGPFYNFCKKAQSNPLRKYYFIIDEINRGNLSRIFGELMMLIEPSKRGEQISILYETKPFSIPSNIHVIGMMNTADRSLAMIDYALRRRFSFFEMQPAFESDQFKNAVLLKDDTCIKDIINIIKELNETISDDDSLGKGFKIGHSYFCCENISNSDIKMIVEYEIIPLLEEYWFDEPSKIDPWKTKLFNALNK